MAAMSQAKRRELLAAEYNRLLSEHAALLNRFVAESRKHDKVSGLGNPPFSELWSASESGRRDKRIGIRMREIEQSLRMLGIRERL
jgi:hypothetical protein